MNETVNTADINECTEINEASYNTGIVLAFLDVVPDLSTLLAALFGYDDPVAAGDSKTALLSVELSNENLKSLTYIRLKILNIACLDLSSVNVDINTLIRTDNAVLNSTCDLNFDRGLVLVSFLDLGSALLGLNIILGKDDLFALIGILNASDLNGNFSVLGNRFVKIEVRIRIKLLT